MPGYQISPQGRQVFAITLFISKPPGPGQKAVKPADFAIPKIALRDCRNCNMSQPGNQDCPLPGAVLGKLTAGLPIGAILTPRSS
ncbi:MAG TPA: hypothetical protein V6C72_03160, partial [Chroococcales cyanobacterium]